MNADEFKAAMAALPEPQTTLGPPHWSHWRRELYRHVTRGDDPHAFQTWPCIYHTMLVNHWTDYVRYELSQLPPSWLPLLAATDPPADYLTLPTGTCSYNLIHQAYHLHRWQSVTGQSIATCDKIIEFGGGYGAMALLAHRLGFSGEYVILDLPEFTLLQQFYLEANGITVAYNRHPTPEAADLLIACYSLSEVEPGERNGILRANPAKSYLFLYSDNFAGYDNLAYFSSVARLSRATWQREPVTHLPTGSYYAFGWQQ